MAEPDKKAEPERPEWDRADHVVARRARRQRQLECPKCGSGRMPESQFCLRCGEPLPKLEHELPPEFAEQRKPRNRARNAILNLWPGLAFPKVWIGSGITIFIALLMIAAVLPVTLALGPAYALFFTPGLGGFGLILFVLGWAWLCAGDIGNPVIMLADLRAGHYAFLAVMTMIGLVIVRLMVP